MGHFSGTACNWVIGLVVATVTGGGLVVPLTMVLLLVRGLASRESLDSLHDLEQCLDSMGEGRAGQEEESEVHLDNEVEARCV